MWKLKEPPPFTERATLTDQEQEVMRLICIGLVQKQVSIELDISKETVHVHLANIKAKLNAKTTAHAAVIFTLGG